MGLIGTPPLQQGFSAVCPVPAGSWNVPHPFRLLVLPPHSSTSPHLLLMLHRTARGWGGDTKRGESSNPPAPKLPGAFQAGTFRKRPALPGCSPTRSFPQPGWEAAAFSTGLLPSQEQCLALGFGGRAEQRASATRLVAMAFPMCRVYEHLLLAFCTCSACIAWLCASK